MRCCSLHCSSIEVQIYAENISAVYTCTSRVRARGINAATCSWCRSSEVMNTLYLLLLSLLRSLVEVQPQTAPYIVFMGETLPNNSYVDLTLVGSRPGQGVECRTDLTTCCGNAQGPHRGDWYFPEGSRPGFFVEGNSAISQLRAPEPQMVQLLRRNNALSPSGIYRCDIATNAVNKAGDFTVRESVYVGIYANGGKTIIMAVLT